MLKEPRSASWPHPFDHYCSTRNTVAPTAQHPSPLTTPLSTTAYLPFYPRTSANGSRSAEREAESAAGGADGRRDCPVERLPLSVSPLDAVYATQLTQEH